MQHPLRDDYFEWLMNIVCGIRFSQNISYRKLLAHLHDTQFRFSIARDQNRAADGADLRYRFATMVNDYGENFDGILDILGGPCSVLEMMIALAVSCEEDIMDNPNMGDRTGQWFWGMIVSLGLGPMTDDRYDAQYVDDVVNRFLDREYEPNGAGGLFTLRYCDRDMRKAEIWHQLCWYLGENFDEVT